MRASTTRPNGLSASGVTIEHSNPKQRFSPRATLYSPPPSETSKLRVVQTRRSPGSKRSITSPRLRQSHRQLSFRLIVNGISFYADTDVLLIHPARQESPVHSEHMPGDKISGIGGQIHSRSDQFLNFPEASHRGAHQELFSARRTVDKCAIYIGGENTGRNGVHAYVVFCPFNRERPRKRNYCRLARRIRGHFKKSPPRGDRSNIDDAACLSFDHLSAKDLAGAQGTGEIRIENPVPLGLADLDGGGTLRHSGGVEQDVHVAELRTHCGVQ